jgi:5-methyltetrahydrofolate--homocysteine methyltransferase
MAKHLKGDARMQDLGKQLITYIADMDEDEAIELAFRMLDDGYDPIQVLNHCKEAMEIVGQRFEANEYFLPELMLAGEMLSQISDKAKPLIKESMDGDEETHGTVLIGTVHGDLHDIGKNIVTFMLEINGFKVVDLGIDVPVDEFVTAIREHSPDVVGLSGFLTLAFDAMKETVEAIQQAGLRDGLQIMIGGGQVDDTVKNYTAADAFGRNAMDAVNLCRKWVGVAA